MKSPAGLVKTCGAFGVNYLSIEITVKYILNREQRLSPESYPILAYDSTYHGFHAT